jgi:hypothetical protein
MNWQHWLKEIFGSRHKARRKSFVAAADSAWATQTLPPPSELQYTCLLVGDAGAVATDGSDAILQLISRELNATAQEKQAVIFLGDNVYPRGLPPEQHRLRAAAEQILDAQIAVLQDFQGKIFCLSGNHDWNKGRPNGLEYVLRQEAYWHQHLQRDDVFRPSLGQLGPEDVLLSEKLVLVILNTQWWVQQGYRPVAEAYSSRTENKRDFFRHLNEILKRHQDKRILVVGHHPLYSNALHAGRFTLKQHLFPLTALHKSLYLPLPVLGSLYPLYRKIVGAREDMAHLRYRLLRLGLLKIFNQHKNIVYAAGHEHNLQYFNRYENHYIVSGAASKVAFVKKGGKASFTHAHKGIAQVLYYTDGQVWLQFLEPDASGKNTEVVYRKRLN